MTVTLADFNTTDVRELLVACLDVPRWVDTVLAGRPYPDLAALTAAARLTLTEDEIRRAIEAHPRIGDRSAAGWSRAEQSGVDDDGAAKFRAANVEYEERFGHVFLVCASGRSGEELLANLRERMTNDPATELAVAGRELVKIAVLRLGKAVTA
ncbi:2-oxo-4-hydroxy-4-carboxy-5-ureidoimidazoline decarboxylase [Amycolatopsis endophytica]|uniref:2-oxo-4-hydroxy-4-carboxy-5-ureidoimidazoline decarboxylase n=1 Tax=Amycolatopsis endophytica TaxID=860233 RepID=A0A853AW30_9PSEU|nr:2-oxo-4-hydroxy-4-carboxy-5-ureidoimidazoline decarboxylase [Amycolatopsis endophytica]NYI86913.1 2-oxo-4-hydroxy-4-carboxy-5-ureidoimidazoline decarboxylase [Amycolatopsis endophytica]